MIRNRMGTGVLIVTMLLMAGASSANAAAQSDTRTTASDDLAGHYLAIQAALAGDSIDKVPEHAAAIVDLVAPANSDGRNETEHPEVTALQSAAKRLAKARNLEDARLAFGDLSELLVLADGLLPSDGLRTAYCPMAGKHWLQTGDKVANPYYGSSMLRCGGFVERPVEASK